ncbi:nuclease-related domain-containing protein [Bacillus sp. 31A1R]|uniref:Nuclease-related domain-containing protein n=1 Tax=Robertmurraya mangrovi TaxID=3098077 RepID=A0ABU5J3N2_9BACI|nr:nuclease-related domain-containing protein [Bacillus sp. 31A1R]MDZ5474043.1 nuclease-related domain-containing protein [Bacillus sp. 31A1R]
MIVKPREMPIYLQKLEALYKRVPKTLPEYPHIKDKYNRAMAGYKGECSIDYPLSFLPKKTYYILHDLRLPVKNRYFQTDTMLISQKFIVIIEIKNMAGKIVFDTDFHQLVRYKDDTEKAFSDPIIQTSNQQKRLKVWLELNKVPISPIVALVVISNPNTTIDSTDRKHLPQKVIHRDYLPTKIEELEKSFQKTIFTEKEIKSIIRQLKKQHTPKNPAILEEFKLTKDQLIKGIQCEKCSFIPLQRANNKWICPQCTSTTKDGHLAALKDYQLLINSSITNSELRDFLQNDSANLARRILSSMNLPYTGTNKGRVYTLNL